MLTLYADIMGFYGADRCKEAYQDIRKRLELNRQVTGNGYKKMTASSGMKEVVPKKSPEYLDFVYRELLSLLKLQERHRQDFKRRGAADIEIKELEQKAREAGITKTALVLVGDFLGEQYAFSKLYDPEFQTEYRK